MIVLWLPFLEASAASHAASVANFSSCVHGAPKGRPKLRDSPQKAGPRHAQRLRRLLQKLALAYGHNGKPAARARMQQTFAKKLAVGGVNQRMRRKNLLEFRERPSRSQQKRAALS